jgi:RecA/RadA recombinase
MLPPRPTAADVMQATSKIIELRRFLAERLPHTRFGLAPIAPPADVLATGVASLDRTLGGGLAKGAFTELVGAGDGSGSAQVLHALLRQVAADGQFMALVDGTDSFDVDAVEPEVLAHLLWVRCAKADEAMKAADLLLRDRNFPLVVLDLKLNPAAELRRIQGTTWYRFARLLEQNGTTVLAITPHPLVSGVAARVRVEAGLGLDALAQSPSALVHALDFTLLRSTAASDREEAVG